MPDVLIAALVLFAVVAVIYRDPGVRAVAATAIVLVAFALLLGWPIHIGR